MMVSIIIPVYNASDSILSTLESVKCQSYKKVEIIAINDGSKDSSAKIISDFIKDNPQLNITLINQSNKGVSAARNAGLKAATGEFIALLDSDDVWLPHKLVVQMGVFKNNPNIDFLACNRNDETLHRFLYKRIDHLTQIFPKDLLYKMFFITPTVIFKRGIIDDVGYFDESQGYCEDGQYFIRICTRKVCYLLNESLVTTGGGKAHFGEKGLSGNLWKMEQGELINIRYAFENGLISYLEYPIIVSFSLMKFFRRFLKSKRSFWQSKFRKL